jgi:hypothetical protein
MTVGASWTSVNGTHRFAGHAVEAPLGPRGSALGEPCDPSAFRLASVTVPLRMRAADPGPPVLPSSA